MERPPSSDARWALSTILLCPTRSLRVQEALTHRRPSYSHWSASSYPWRHYFDICTFFLNCLYIASSASLTVTPFRFRAVTSSPSGKWRSIFLTGGLVRNFLSASLSSSVAGDVFSFLWFNESISRDFFFMSTATTTTTTATTTKGQKIGWHEITTIIWWWRAEIDHTSSASVFPSLSRFLCLPFLKSHQPHTNPGRCMQLKEAKEWATYPDRWCCTLQLRSNLPSDDLWLLPWVAMTTSRRRPNRPWWDLQYQRTWCVLIEFYGSTICEGRQSGVQIWLVRDSKRWIRYEAAVCIYGRGGSKQQDW